MQTHIFYSRPNGTGNFKATYIDLDEIANKTQTDIPIPSEVHLPKDLEEISSITQVQLWFGKNVIACSVMQMEDPSNHRSFLMN